MSPGVILPPFPVYPGDSAPPSGPASGDLGGTYPGPSVVGLQGRALSGSAPSTGQVLEWGGASWAPTSIDQFAVTPTAVKTANYNAAAGDLVVCNPQTVGAFTVTFPTAPPDRTMVGAIIATATAVGNPVTLAAGGTDVFNFGGITTNTLRLGGECRIFQYQASTGIWFSVSTTPVSALLTYIMTAANVETTFGAAGQVYAGTGAATGKLLAAGSAGQRLTIGGADASLLEWTSAPPQSAGEAGPIPSLIAQTVARTNCASLTAAIVVATGDVGFCPVYLYEGQVIGHLAWCSGSTAGTNLTHQWLALCDSNLNMLARTADQGAAAIGADTFFSYAIAQIASGAASSYTVPADGFYYIALAISSTGTVPTQIGPASLLSSLMGAASSLVTLNDTTGNAGPPAFPHQFTNSGALATRLSWLAALT